MTPRGSQWLFPGCIASRDTTYQIPHTDTSADTVSLTVKKGFPKLDQHQCHTNLVSALWRAEASLQLYDLMGGTTYAYFQKLALFLLLLYQPCSLSQTFLRNATVETGAGYSGIPWNNNPTQTALVAHGRNCEGCLPCPLPGVSFEFLVVLASQIQVGNLVQTVRTCVGAHRLLSGAYYGLTCSADISGDMDDIRFHPASARVCFV
jgi:hypothetical protein